MFLFTLLYLYLKTLKKANMYEAKVNTRTVFEEFIGSYILLILFLFSSSSYSSFLTLSLLASFHFFPSGSPFPPFFSIILLIC